MRTLVLASLLLTGCVNGKPAEPDCVQLPQDSIEIKPGGKYCVKVTYPPRDTTAR